MHRMKRVITLPLLLALLSSCDRTAPPSSSIEVAVKGIHGAAISDNGEYSVIGSIHHGGSFWQHDSQERLYNWNHKENELSTIVAADFSHQGKWVLTANPFNLVLWDTDSGKGERFWTAPGEILDAELGPNGNMALLGLSDHTAVIFNVKRGGILRTLQHSNRVRSVDLSRDGKLALTGSEDFTAVLWDVTSGEKLKTIKHEDDVQLVKISPDGTLALSVSKYDKALLWDTLSGKSIGEVPLASERLKRGVRFTSARFSDDASLLITGRPDQIIELWDTATLSIINRWKAPKRSAWKPTSAAIVDVGFTKDQQGFWAIASNGYIHKLAL
ncbi:MAG: hypothetical protein K6L81_07610 [Agarilytica sp.]